MNMRTTIKIWLARDPQLSRKITQAQKAFALAFPPAVIALAWAVYALRGGK